MRNSYGNLVKSIKLTIEASKELDTRKQTSKLEDVPGKFISRDTYSRTRIMKFECKIV